MIENSTRPNTQSELTAEMSDPELSGALLNSVNSSFKKKGKVTAVIEKLKTRYQKATGNQTMFDQHGNHVGPRTPNMVSPQ